MQLKLSPQDHSYLHCNCFWLQINKGFILSTDKSLKLHWFPKYRLLYLHLKEGSHHTIQSMSHECVTARPSSNCLLFKLLSGCKIWKWFSLCKTHFRHNVLTTSVTIKRTWVVTRYSDPPLLWVNKLTIQHPTRSAEKSTSPPSARW